MIETITTSHRLACVFQDILIERLEDEARWREVKAEEWPDDLRNRNAAEALRTAAEVVRQFEPNELPAVRRFTEFAQLLESEGLGFGDDPWPLVRGSFVAGRFHFDNQRRGVTYVEVVDCLSDMFRESVKEYGDALDSNDVSPELRRYFKAYGVLLEKSLSK